MENVHLYKFLTREAFNKVISNQSLKFTNPIKFNDPFDCVIDRIHFDISDVGEDVKNDLEKLRKKFGPDLTKIPQSKISDFYAKSIQKKIERTAVTCFSLNCGNPLMWSHYAEEHYGVCLVFELEWSTSPFPKISHDKLNISPVNYDEKPSFNYLKNKLEATKNLLFNKSKHWEYENELRITSLIAEGFYEYKQEFLRGVVFGLRFPSNEIEKTKELISNKGFVNLKYGRARREGLNFRIIDL